MHQSVKLTRPIWLSQLVNSSPLIHAFVWPESNPQWDLNPGPQHERRRTYQLRYPPYFLIVLYLDNFINKYSPLASLFYQRLERSWHRRGQVWPSWADNRWWCHVGEGQWSGSGVYTVPRVDREVWNTPGLSVWHRSDLSYIQLPSHSCWGGSGSFLVHTTSVIHSYIKYLWFGFFCVCTFYAHPDFIIYPNVSKIYFCFSPYLTGFIATLKGWMSIYWVVPLHKDLARSPMNLLQSGTYFSNIKT